MRFVIPLLLSALFVTGTAYAQPAGTQPGAPATAGTMPPSPNNCGTPDEPKPCPGANRMTRHSRPKTAAAVHATGTSTPK